MRLLKVLNKKIGCKRERIFLSCCLFAAYFTSQFNAMSLVKEEYLYFKPHILTFSDHGLALLLLTIPVLFLPLGSTSTAATAWAFYCFIYFSAIVSGIGLFQTKIEFINFIKMVAFGGLVTILGSCIKLPVLQSTKINFNFFAFMLFACVVLVIYTWGLSGFTFLGGLKTIYERRFAARENPSYVGYVIAPLRLAVPLLAIFAWQIRKNLLWIFVAIFGAISLFSYEGSKASLIFPALLWLILLGLRKNKLPAVLLLSLLALNLLARAEFLLFGSSHLIWHGVRRIIVVPGMIATFYWNYAPSVENLNNITFQIGQKYFGDAQCNANTNYLMWGWLWAGWFGVALIAWMAGLVVSVFGSYPGKRFPCLGALMAAGCIFFWSEQFLHTSMLSSGVVLLVAIAILIGIIPNGFSKIAPKTS